MAASAGERTVAFGKLVLYAEAVDRAQVEVEAITTALYDAFEQGNRALSLDTKGGGDVEGALMRLGFMLAAIGDMREVIEPLCPDRKGARS